jgi:hypothetical protein
VGNQGKSGLGGSRLKVRYANCWCWLKYGVMKKLKNEKELVKKAIAIGVAYGEKRGAVEFEPTDSANEKLEYIYRLLVHDKLIKPLPEEQVSQEAIRHRLAIWASKQKD